jgi:membrane protease YdiL (CAAX protease family)
MMWLYARITKQRAAPETRHGVFVEELLFRGVVQTQIAERTSSLLVAILFGTTLFLFMSPVGLFSPFL